MPISIFTFFFIFLALTIFFNLWRYTASKSITYNRAIQTFFIYSNCYFTESGLNTFDRIVKNKTIKNPNQIFTLALQTAVERLEEITSAITQAEFASKKCCSNSLSLALSQIAGGVEIMLVNPFVEELSGEQWNEMMDRIIVASVNLKYCLDGLGKSKDVIGVGEKVREVQVYISGCEQFMRNYRGEISESGRDEA